MPRYTPTVKDYMTPIPRFIAPHEPLITARDVMRTSSVRHLPVVDGAELVGIISERDIGLPPGVAGRTVEDVMTREIYTVVADMPLNKVARDMAHRKINSAVVMDGNTIAGILTAVDALHALADALEGKHARAFSAEHERVITRGTTRPASRAE